MHKILQQAFTIKRERDRRINIDRTMINRMPHIENNSNIEYNSLFYRNVKLLQT